MDEINGFLDDDWVNRRKQPRFRVKECLVRCARDGLLGFLRKPDSEPGPVLNLSAGGVEFLSAQTYSKGQQLRLSMDVPAFDEVLEMRGLVRWVLEVPDRQMIRVGVEFTHISDEVVESITRLERDGLLRNVERERDTLL